MRDVNQDLLKHSLDLWKEVHQEIEDVFGLVSTESPSNVVISSKNNDLGDLTPGAFTGTTIVINSKIPNYMELLPATITKLCFQSSMPQDILCGECIDDLSFEFARQRIASDILRNQWESLWSEHTPQRRISTVIEYHPCTAYAWLYSVAGEKGLETIVREITHRARNQIPLSFEEYLLYFSKRVSRFENRLDATELKLARHLIENPELKYSDLATLTGITQEWVSTKISELQKRMILRQFNHVPFSRLGINMFHVLLSKKSSEVDSFSLLRDCPFLYSFRKVMSGEWNALVTLCIPNNQKSIETINEGLGCIQQAGFEMHTHHISSSGVSHCFDYYSTRKEEWDIPWELLAIHLQRIHTENLASSMPRIDTPEEKTDIPLDDLDIKILECVREGLSSVSKIRSHLKVGQHRVADRLQQLRKERLIVKMWEAHNIGLSEHVFVHTEEKEIADAIAAWSLRMPRAIVSFSGINDLMLLVNLPKGGSFGLATAIGELQSNVSVGILGSSTYGSWDFPSSLWDSKFQKWRCPEERLERWIQSLD